MRGAEFGVWGMGCGVWGVGCGVWGVTLYKERVRKQLGEGVGGGGSWDGGGGERGGVGFGEEEGERRWHH